MLECASTTDDADKRLHTAGVDEIKIINSSFLLLRFLVWYGGSNSMHTIGSIQQHIKSTASAAAVRIMPR